jgi:hypothetical protein
MPPVLMVGTGGTPLKTELDIGIKRCLLIKSNQIFIIQE